MIFDIVQEWALCRDAMLAAIAETKGTHTEDDILTGLVTGSGLTADPRCRVL